MNQSISLLVAVIFFMFTAMATAQPANLSQKNVGLKNTLVKEDLTQSTRVVKKSKMQKLSKKSVLKKRKPKSNDEMQIVAKHGPKNPGKKLLKKNKATRTLASKKTGNKKYWSVECRQGFIKDSYVYCARKTASAPVSKKPVVKRMMARKASKKEGAVLRK